MPSNSAKTPNSSNVIRAVTSAATTVTNMGRNAIVGAVAAGAGGAIAGAGAGGAIAGAGAGGGAGANAAGGAGATAGATAGAALKNYPYEIGPLNIPELMKLLTLLLPYFIVFLFIMLSIINSNIKGFIYFFGLIIIYGIIKIFQRTVPNNQKEHICHIFDSYHYVHPSFISALYAYTIVYMITPMAIYNVFNIPLIIILLVFSVIDLIVRYKSGCSNALTISVGSILGAGFAVMWAYILKESGNSTLLYYDDLVSNKQSCSRTSNEQFKCSVYKNGELLNTLNSNSNLSSS
jgi:hypothetical protein